jgi:hypothetical protein
MLMLSGAGEGPLLATMLTRAVWVDTVGLAITSDPAAALPAGPVAPAQNHEDDNAAWPATEGTAGRGLDPAGRGAPTRSIKPPSATTPTMDSRITLRRGPVRGRRTVWESRALGRRALEGGEMG